MKADIVLPEALKKGVSPGAPLPLKLMLARGQLPLGVADRLGVLALLEDDADGEVREAVASGFETFDLANLKKSLADSAFQAALLEVAAEKFTGTADLAAVIVSHPNATTRVLANYVESDDPAVLSRLAENQRVLLTDHDLVRRLLANPLLEHSVGGRLASIIGLQDYLPPTRPGQAPVTGTDEATVAPGTAEDIAGQIGFEGEIPENFSVEVPEELLFDAPDESSEQIDFNDNSNRDSTNLYKIIQEMSIAEKIKLATLGSKSARKLLARDSNRIVVTAVVRSPKIREDEIVPIAQDRLTPDDVLVYIFTRKDWMKNYQIRMGLIKNPKTPIPKALRLLESVQDRDLRSLAKNRNVPTAISGAALRMIARKAH